MIGDGDGLLIEGLAVGSIDTGDNVLGSNVGFLVVLVGWGVGRLLGKE